MDRREIIHVINHAGCHHRAGAAGTLFSRLENQFNDAIELGGILLEHAPAPARWRYGRHGRRRASCRRCRRRNDRDGAVAIVMLFVEIEGIHIDAKAGLARAARCRAWPPRRRNHLQTPAASAPARPVRGRVRKPGPVSSSGSPIRLSASMTSRPAPADSRARQEYPRPYWRCETPASRIQRAGENRGAIGSWRRQLAEVFIKLRHSLSCHK